MVAEESTEETGGVDEGSEVCWLDIGDYFEEDLRRELREVFALAWETGVGLRLVFVSNRSLRD